MFDCNWYLRDLSAPDKNVNVLSCFSCGGGSTMGYKRAGFNVVGNIEIDSVINKMYVKNHNPKYNFNMDLREFNKTDNLPRELFGIDILDGSPPCTTFSTAGLREKTWGKQKKFREGQAEQTLDDLFFVFLDTVEKLQPKIVIAENVTGLIKGNAKGYVNLILKRFSKLGYAAQLFKLNSAFMEVPQKRERVFFIANNQKFPKLKLNFAGVPIKFGEVRTPKGKPVDKNSLTAKRLSYLRLTDNCIADITKRMENRVVQFSARILHDDKVADTITSSGSFYRAYDKMRLSDKDIMNVSTFPQDYDFCGNSVQYVCGMSVPPNMTASVAAEIYRQWIKKS